MRYLSPRRSASLGIDRLAAGDKNTVLRVEMLEERRLMTAEATAEVSILTVATSTPVGLTPAEVRSAYGFNQITFENGAIQGNGSGQTIAIVDAYGDPNIASDLSTFDAEFGLAPANLKVVNQNGGAAQPVTSPTWSLETALDVEWAHAVAPGANILLVEASTASLTDLLTAVNYARESAEVSVISMSWGTSEFASETSYDSDFTTPSGHTGETFVASSGDNGAPSGWPALSSNVLAVGGTSLTVGAGGAYESETAWSGSGGSTSLYESEASDQEGVESTGMRTGPDVSYDANPSTGFAVYDSVALSGQSGWFEVGGTSAGAPQWAGLLAIANEGRALAGEGTLENGQAAIYSLSSSDFHDITSGSNGAYAATVGYDQVTGRGTPIANLIAAGLVEYGMTTPAPPTEPTSPIRTIPIGKDPTETSPPAQPTPPTPPPAQPTPPPAQPTPPPAQPTPPPAPVSSPPSSGSTNRLPGPILAKDEYFAGVGASTTGQSPTAAQAAEEEVAAAAAAVASAISSDANGALRLGR